MAVMMIIFHLLLCFMAFAEDHGGPSNADQPPRHGHCGKSYPLIWDNDANYDDTLAFLYFSKSANFDLKAITVGADGMATPHGGPTNLAAVAKLVGKGKVPIAFGHQSLSPIVTMPLQWRIELDDFFEKMFQSKILEPNDAAISELSAPHLIQNVLRESECPVVILTTGPVTNLAVALEADPSLVRKIQAVFMMGSAYGVPGTSNVYNWQMTFNGVRGSCSEAPGQIYTGLDPPLVEHGKKFLARPGCRGVDMSKHGNTEWNVFMDVRAWRAVYGLLAESNVSVYVLASNATLDMPITLKGIEDHAHNLHDEKMRIFMVELAKAFLGAGEAKWWDAQCAVMMEQVISGQPGGVCSNWAWNKKTAVSLVWRSNLLEHELNPYGSIVDDLNAHAPPVNYCLGGNSTQMWEVFWPMLDK